MLPCEAVGRVDEVIYACRRLELRAWTFLLLSLLCEGVWHVELLERVDVPWFSFGEAFAVFLVEVLGQLQFFRGLDDFLVINYLF